MIDLSKITEQKISEKYEGLPQDLKNVLSSVNTSITVGNIAAKYHLDEEKTTMLVQLIGLVILGFAGFNDMKEEMKETIEIDPPFIPLITDEIRQKIFLPVMDFLQKASKAPVPSTSVTPATVIPAPTPAATTPPRPVAPPAAPTPTRPVDEYREPTFSMPEIVDLRKTPPAVSKVEPPPAPSLPPKPIIPMQPVPATPTPPPPTSPLTFTRPVEPATPLIEAEPHKIPPSAPRPQYIMRPSGLPPTDLPENVLDLRKDRGEF